MRRIVLWALSTLSTLVLLFSYHTSTSSASTAAGTVVAAGANGVGSAAGTTTSGGTTSGGTTTGGSTSGGTTTGGSTSGGTTTGGSTSGGTTSGGTTAGSASAATYTGTAVLTRFGNVQVQITVTSGKLSAVTVLQVPNSNGKDQQINSRAVPILNREAIAAQSSAIDMVSGATYTSQGYITSLQSALDQAGI